MSPFSLKKNAAGIGDEGGEALAEALMPLGFSM
jgi:hypothetical protein